MESSRSCNLPALSISLWRFDSVLYHPYFFGESINQMFRVVDNLNGLIAICFTDVMSKIIFTNLPNIDPNEKMDDETFRFVIEEVSYQIHDFADTMAQLSSRVTDNKCCIYQVIDLMDDEIIAICFDRGNAEAIVSNIPNVNINQMLRTVYSSDPFRRFQVQDITHSMSDITYAYAFVCSAMNKHYLEDLEKKREPAIIQSSFDAWTDRNS